LDPKIRAELVGERARLEESEIETSLSGTPATVYHRLMIVYLSLGDGLAAKFLWQRIPATTRESSPDLARLWIVGRALLERDPAETFKALPVEGWKSCKKEEIDHLRECLRTQYLDVVSAAYSSISSSELSTYVGLSEPEAVALAGRQPGWSVDAATGFVRPAGRPEPAVGAQDSEQKLTRLTDFIGFLEK